MEFAVLTEFTGVIGVMRNLKFQIPAVLSKFKTLRVVAKSATPITTMKPLAGKKIATILGTNLHFLVVEALKRDGVSAELVNVGPADMIAALVRGDVDAAATFPSAYQAVRRTLGTQYQEIPVPGISQSFVIVASDKVATKTPALMWRLLAVLLKGERLVAADPLESQEAVSRYVGQAIPLELIQASWPEYEFRVQLDTAPLDQRWRRAPLARR